MNKKGFTLVEVMIVTGITVILGTVFITILNPARQLAKARDSNRKSDLSIISAGLEQIYAEANAYPPESGTGASSAWGCLFLALMNGDVDCDGSSDVDSVLKVMPAEPKADDGYAYCYSLVSGSDQSYAICAWLEAGADDELNGLSESEACVPSPSDAGLKKFCLTNPF